MSYVPARYFARSPEQRRDPMLAWARTDLEFFAAGACHILAWAFVCANPAAAFDIIHLSDGGSQHVYVSNGMWAFNFWGWTVEDEILATTQAQRRVVRQDLTEFCAASNHRLPEQFPFNPWPRALAYVQRFGGRAGAVIGAESL